MNCSTTPKQELESLLEERLTLTRENLALIEEFGSGGSHTLQRDILKAELARTIRHACEENGQKLTAAKVDEMVISDPGFKEFHESAIARRKDFLLVKEHLYELSQRTRFLINSLNTPGEQSATSVTAHEEDDPDDETVQE